MTSHVIMRIYFVVLVRYIFIHINNGSYADSPTFPNARLHFSPLLYKNTLILSKQLLCSCVQKGHCSRENIQVGFFLTVEVQRLALTSTPRFEVASNFRTLAKNILISLVSVCRPRPCLFLKC